MPVKPLIAAIMTDQRTRLAALVLAILAAAMMRLIPHPPNFTPIGAMALFGGAYLGRRWMAFAAPLAALLLSDIVLGFYAGMWVQYLATAMAVGLGAALLSRRRPPARIAGAAVASAILFFGVTNLGVWASSGMYPLTAAGLADCFAAALPFFQNSLAGDILFTALLFGGWAMAERSIPALRQPEPITA